MGGTDNGPASPVTDNEPLSNSRQIDLEWLSIGVEARGVHSGDARYGSATLGQNGDNLIQPDDPLCR